MKLSLEPVDLSSAEKHECPGINNEDYFLAVIDDGLWFGRFNRQWYGWDFVCGFGVCGSRQFDAPGYNSSRWQKLWRVVAEK